MRWDAHQNKMGSLGAETGCPGENLSSLCLSLGGRADTVQPLIALAWTELFLKEAPDSCVLAARLASRPRARLQDLCLALGWMSLPASAHIRLNLRTQIAFLELLDLLLLCVMHCLLYQQGPVNSECHMHSFGNCTNESESYAWFWNLDKLTYLVLLCFLKRAGPIGPRAAWILSRAEIW